MLRPIIASCAVLISVLLASSANAEACTYNEAMMALNNGNLVRGQTLMRMAARDGDQRAMVFLASLERKMNQSKGAGNALHDTLAVLSASATAQTTARQRQQQKIN